MGYFNKQPLGSGQPATPLTRQRVQEALDGHGWVYQVDDDGDIAAGWDEGYFWFFFYGESQQVLQVRGTWNGKLDQSHAGRALELVNEINTDRLFPKMYTFAPSDDELQVRGEFNMDYQHGVTDEQLSLHVGAAISSTMGAFARFAETFPDAAPVAEE